MSQCKRIPLGKSFTNLAEPDYNFLERFLDVTKANLFFAKGVILVEGWAEELLLSILASKIGISLTKHGISIVNIGSTAFLRYSRIFQRTALPHMTMPVAVITDVDVQPLEAGKTKSVQDPAHADDPTKKINVPLTGAEIKVECAQAITTKSAKYSAQSVQSFISPYWTLEYCIALSPTLRKVFYKSVLEALREEKQDAGVQDLTAYDAAITAIESHFNNWADNAEQIAFAIMNQILTGENNVGVARKKISKAIIAQFFSKNLTESNDDFDLDNQLSIKYLLDAIRYAVANH